MVSVADLGANLKQAESLIAQASEKGAKLVVLPENFALFGSPDIVAQAAVEQRDAVIQQFLSALAKRHQLIVVGGTIALPAEAGRVYATSFVYAENGDCLGFYRKIHLFDAEVGDAHGRYRESESYAPGDKVVVLNTALGRLGLGVCYDLRFPELFRAMQDLAVDIIALPSAFTRSTGLAHWLPLLRARAIENQCMVVAANQGGIHDAKRQTSGGSAIVDSWGRVLAEAGFGAGLVVADYDALAQQALRKRMPVAQHRRL